MLRLPPPLPRGSQTALVATSTPRDTLPPYPTNPPTGTPTPTLDPCTAYVTALTAISAQFEIDLVKVKADVASHDMDSLSWDWSQILNFAISKVEILQPPAQFAGFNQSFLAELHAYADGAKAYLQADPVTGAVKFAEGDALRSAQAGAVSQLSCSR